VKLISVKRPGAWQSPNPRRFTYCYNEAAPREIGKKPITPLDEPIRITER
jgi:hypothetical protein